MVCFRLQDSKIVVVNNTAVATLRQLVINIFEKVQEEDDINNKDGIFIKKFQIGIYILSIFTLIKYFSFFVRVNKTYKYRSFNSWGRCNSASSLCERCVLSLPGFVLIN